MRERHDLALLLGALERPLPQKAPFAIEDGDSLVAAGKLAVGDVDVSGLRVDVDGGREEELSAVGVQRLTLASPVR